MAVQTRQTKRKGNFDDDYSPITPSNPGPRTICSNRRCRSKPTATFGASPPPTPVEIQKSNLLIEFQVAAAKPRPSIPFNLLMSREVMEWKDAAKARSVNDSFRSEILQWMSKICIAQRYHSETFWIAATLFDRYLRFKPTNSKKQLYVIAHGTVFIAAKLHEELLEPEFADFVGKTKYQIYESTIKVRETNKIAERKILHQLNWNIMIVTPFALLQELLLSLGCSDPRTCKDARTKLQSLYHMLAMLFCTSIFDSVLSYYSPSKLLIACLDFLNSQGILERFNLNFGKIITILPIKHVQFI